MSSVDMVDAGSGQKTQAFPLKVGKINLTSGTYTGVNMSFCVAAGDIVVTWKDGTFDTISCEIGDYFSMIDAAQVVVTGASGTFHLA